MKMFKKYTKKYKEEQASLKKIKPELDKVVDDYVAEENRKLRERADKYREIFDKTFVFIGKHFTPIGVFSGSVFKTQQYITDRGFDIIGITEGEYRELRCWINKTEPSLHCFSLEGHSLQEYRFDSENKIEAVIKNL